MSNLFVKHSPWLIVALAMVIFGLAGLLGGPGATPDVGIIQALAAERAAHPGLTSLAIAVTNIGGAPGMVSILTIAVVVLAVQRRWKTAWIVAAIVLGGRGAVELLKLVVDRPRPSFGPYPVGVSSLSFPSAHAANSMITLLTIAMTLPVRYRALATTAAVCLSGVVGSTRPYLGVHWPSDVVGGWAFGIAWAVSLTTASGYWLALRENRAA